MPSNSRALRNLRRRLIAAVDAIPVQIQAQPDATLTGHNLLPLGGCIADAVELLSDTDLQGALSKLLKSTFEGEDPLTMAEAYGYFQQALAAVDIKLADLADIEADEPDPRRGGGTPSRGNHSPDEPRRFRAFTTVGRRTNHDRDY
jgi:hypothetical protein